MCGRVENQKSMHQHFVSETRPRSSEGCPRSVDYRLGRASWCAVSERKACPLFAASNPACPLHNHHSTPSIQLQAL